jgi:hypothetical protein
VSGVPPFRGWDPLGRNRRLRERITPLLQPGERLQAVVQVALDHSSRPYRILLLVGFIAAALWAEAPRVVGVAGLVILVAPAMWYLYRSVPTAALVFTDRNVVVIETRSLMSDPRPGRVIARLSRSSRIGPIPGNAFIKLIARREVGGIVVYVVSTMRAEAAAADELAPEEASDID